VGLKSYGIFYLPHGSQSILHCLARTDATIPCNVQATNRDLVVPGIGDDASANTRGDETRYLVLLLDNLRGTHVAE
jgi:hypothetical protein